MIAVSVSISLSFVLLDLLFIGSGSIMHVVSSHSLASCIAVSLWLRTCVVGMNGAVVFVEGTVIQE